MNKLEIKEWREELKAKLMINAMAFLGIAILLLNAFPVHAEITEPHNADAMWIEPASLDLITASIGHLFNITLACNISSTHYVGVWQAKISFNATYVNATRAGYTYGTKSDWFKAYTPITAEPEINNELGYVLVGESLLAEAVPSPSAGTLSWIEFNVTNIPHVLLTLQFNISASYLAPPSAGDTYIGNDENVPFTPYDGIAIIPEFSSLLLVASLMVLTLVGVTLNKKSTRKPKVD
jgi:hypothetical protein